MLFRRVAILLLFSALTLTPALSGSQTVSTTDSSSAVHTLPGSALGDSSRAFVPGAGVDASDTPLRSNTERPLSMYLARNTQMLFGYEIYRASQMECAWQGAGMGMTLGMCAGALGMTAGLWEEGTSWYIAGAMAALGAIWGSTKADDPQWTVRVRWEPEK